MGPELKRGWKNSEEPRRDRFMAVSFETLREDGSPDNKSMLSTV